MYSTQNSLKVYVSPLLAQTSIANVNDLLEGELGFFNKDTGALISDGIGTGYFGLMKNGEVIKSKELTFAGWAAAKDSYSAPTLKTSTITIPSATVGETYQVNIEVKLVGMSGEYYLHGAYIPVTGDDVTAVATAIVARLNEQLVREGKTDLLTITNVAGVITVVSKFQTYIQGKKQGRPADFTSRMILPADIALIETVTQATTDGIGYGPYIAEKEYLAQGDSDAHRLQDWRNNFDWTGNATSTGRYDIVVLKVDNQQKTANARVDAPMEYIIAFNSIGTTPSPIIDASVNGDTTVTGVAYPGSSVILSVDGSPESAVTAHATTGVYTVTVTVATDEVLTATAQDGANPISATSNAVTVTAT